MFKAMWKKSTTPFLGKTYNIVLSHIPDTISDKNSTGLIASTCRDIWVEANADLC